MTQVPAQHILGSSVHVKDLSNTRTSLKHLCDNVVHKSKNYELCLYVTVLVGQ